MQIKDIKFITVLAGLIGLLLGLFAIFVTISYGVTSSWRTILGFIFNLIIIVGSIGVFVSSSKITIWSMNKFYIIYIPLIFACFAHDLVYLTIVNAFSGIIFQFILFVIYRYRKKNPVTVDPSGRQKIIKKS